MTKSFFSSASFGSNKFLSLFIMLMWRHWFFLEIFCKSQERTFHFVCFTLIFQSERVAYANYNSHRFFLLLIQLQYFINWTICTPRSLKAFFMYLCHLGNHRFSSSSYTRLFQPPRIACKCIANNREVVFYNGKPW